jgi:O-antigen ligase
VKPARKTSRPSQRPAPSRKGAAAVPSAAPEPFGRWMGLLALWLLVLVTPLLIDPSAKEAFRLLKGLASGWLALASLVFFALEVRKVGTIRWSDLWDRPAVRVVVPILLVATASLAATSHPLHVREGLADLWIGAAVLVGWSLALEPRRLERLLLGLLVPASLLALLGILQFHGLYRPYQLIGIEHDPRLAIISRVGNPGDLGVYLVLPGLIAQWAVARRRGWARILAGVALALCLYAVVVTQTLAALAALAVGSALLWALLLPRRRAVLLFGGGAALALVLVLAVTPLRDRIAAKAGQALSGDWNSVLTGRLDGWRAALWMVREHPWTGVGHGAYRPEYVPVLLELLDRGVPMYPLHIQPVFANAHNEYLEAVADWGLLGIAALAWGLWVLVASLRRAPRDEGQALAWAGVAALAVLSFVYFPFRIALLAFPALLFLSWVFRRGTPREGEEST